MLSESCEDFVMSLISPRAEFWIQQSAVALGNLHFQPFQVMLTVKLLIEELQFEILDHSDPESSGELKRANSQVSDLLIKQPTMSQNDSNQEAFNHLPV